MTRLAPRSTSVRFLLLNTASALPLFLVGVLPHPRLALLALLVTAGLGLASFLAVTRPPRQRLVETILAWQDGKPSSPDSGLLPSEYAEVKAAMALAMARMGEREAELQAATRQQHILMQEIHHRVKNNLQIVASLLNLQANRIKVPAAQAEFQSARDRVRALATLHRHLYAHGELQTINLREFLTELCGQLFSAFGETPGARIDLHVDAPELQMSSDQAVPLALIVTETVSNSVKFAFPEGRRGRIDIRVSSEGGEAELVVSDDGVGMEAAPGAGEEPGTGRRDGIGLQLIRGFARQLGGTLDIRDGTGTTYTVRMKLQRDRPIVSSLGVRPAA